MATVSQSDRVRKTIKELRELRERKAEILEQEIAELKKQKVREAGRVESFARGTNKFITDVAGLPVDVIANTRNQFATGDFGVPKSFQQPEVAPIVNPFGGGNSITRGVNALGINTSSEGANPTAYNYGRNAAIVDPFGAAAVTAAQKYTDNPYLQAVAGLTPAGALRGSVGALRTMTRGTRREQMARNVSELESQNLPVTMGTTAPSGVGPGIEAGTAVTTGGHGVIRRVGEEFSEQTKNLVNSFAQATSPVRGQTQAGTAIKTGLVEFGDKISQRYRVLESRFLSHFDGNEGVSLTNTDQYLQSQVAQSDAAKDIAGGIQSSQMQDIANRVREVVDSGRQLSLSEIKEIRTMVGSRLKSLNLLDDASTAQWSQLYGALTEDMRVLARAKGGRALKDFENTNKFWSKSMKRVNEVINPLIRKKTGEAVMSAVMSGTDKGAQSLWRIKRSVTPEQWDVLQATVVDELGLVTASAQNAEQTAYSIDRFLTNYNNLHFKARTALFNPELRRDLDLLARNAEKVRKASRYLANPSGSGAAVLVGGSSLAAGLGAGSWLFSGNFKIAASIAASAAIVSPGISFGVAKLMTHPPAVKWFAKATKLEVSDIPSHLARLVLLANREKDPDMKNLMLSYANSEQQRYASDMKEAAQLRQKATVSPNTIPVPTS